MTEAGKPKHKAIGTLVGVDKSVLKLVGKLVQAVVQAGAALTTGAQGKFVPGTRRSRIPEAPNSGCS
jgi:hypothetical protein